MINCDIFAKMTNYHVCCTRRPIPMFAAHISKLVILDKLSTFVCKPHWLRIGFEMGLITATTPTDFFKSDFGFQNILSLLFFNILKQICVIPSKKS